MTQLDDPKTPATASRVPFTGAEYLESLRDGREVWLHGERVRDVTTHPAFRNTARMAARLYDAMHAPEYQGILTVPTDTGNGGFTHPSFKPAWTQEELRKQAKAVEAWARITYGWLGRSPDYKATFIASLGANPDFFAPYQDNARRWYVEAQERALYINHAIINPPIDRDRGPGAIEDVCVRVIEENDAGLVVSGAKVVATNAALTQYNMIGNVHPVPDKQYAPVFLCPMDAPGVKLICRPSYELNSAVLSDPFDYPLSSRFDENDSILILDNVLVPWENVFAYELEQSNGFMERSGFFPRTALQACTRLAVKFDFLTGLLVKGLEMTGAIGFRGVQTRLGELVAYRNLFWMCVDSMVENPSQWFDGTLIPNPDAGTAYRLMMTQAYPRAKEIFQQDLASALIYLPASARDWKNPELRPYIDRFIRGSGQRSAEERVKLLKVIWDAVGTEFGGRHELYERNYSGNHEMIRIQAYQAAEAMGQIGNYKAMVDQFMSEYDLNGWTASDLINNDDVAVSAKDLQR